MSLNVTFINGGMRMRKNIISRQKLPAKEAGKDVRHEHNLKTMFRVFQLIFPVSTSETTSCRSLKRLARRFYSSTVTTVVDRPSRMSRCKILSRNDEKIWRNYHSQHILHACTSLMIKENLEISFISLMWTMHASVAKWQQKACFL